MNKGVFELDDRAASVELKHCPMLKTTCLGEACQWWVMDYQEDRKTYRSNCAVTLIAHGVNDESLLRLSGGRPVTV